jgi:hypothetical protein
MRSNLFRLKTKVSQCAALLALAFAIVGCERATTTTSSVEKFESPNSEIEFFEDLEKNQVVSNNDALHSFFLLTDKDDGWTTYDERVAEAKRRKWLPSSFDEPANESAEVGWVASASCRIAKIRGGLSMMVIGPTPRYAVRELTHMQILMGKKETQSFSGLEFVDYLTRLGRMTDLSSGSVLEKLPNQATGQEPTAKPLPPTGRFE